MKQTVNYLFLLGFYLYTCLGFATNGENLSFLFSAPEGYSEIRDVNLGNFEPDTINDSSEVEVIIVGAGPVGLSTAINFILLTGKKVVVIDKRQEYIREHILYMHETAFPAIFTSNNESDAINKYNALRDDCLENNLISIKRLEIELKEIALSLGVMFQHYELKEDNVEDLLKVFPNANILIGADGVRSITRKIIESDFIDIKTLDHFIQIDIPYNNKFRKKKIQDRIEIANFVNLNILVEHENKVLINFFNVPKESFGPLKKAKAKNQCSINDHIIPRYCRHGVKKYVRNWGKKDMWGCKKKIRYKKFNRTSFLAIPLNLAKAWKVRGKIEIGESQREVHVALIGDALHILPYFRNNNLGMRSAFILAKLIYKNKDTAKALKKFEGYINTKFDRESNLAKQKFEQIKNFH